MKVCSCIALAAAVLFAAPALAQIAPPEQSAMLSALNAERAITPATPSESPLTWDPNLASYAQQWADYLATNNAWMHRDDPNSPPAYNTINNPYYPGQSLGENLYEASASDDGTLGPAAVQSWISEKQYYNYAQDDGNGDANQPPGCTAPQGNACGHYTQVIWSATQSVGCGKATGTDGWTRVVCNFYPAGNYLGQKPY